MRGKSAVVAVLVLLVTLVCFRPAVAADAQATAPSPSWPHTTSINGASIEVYQPQAIDWKDHEILTARAAVAITRPGTTTPVLGTVEVALKTETDAATNTVSFTDPKLLGTHFPSLDTQQAAQLEDKIRQALPEMKTRHVPLQAILLSLGQTAHPRDVTLHNAPPVIFYSDKPASLVVFDGDPVLAPVGKTGLSFAVNTNWDVFSDGNSWYLLNGDVWMSAPAYAGPYRYVTRLPPAFERIPTDRNFAAVRKAIPPKHRGAGIVPKIFVSTKPADIIVTNGPPKFTPVAGTGLQSVRNTNADLFLYPSSGQVLRADLRTLVLRAGPGRSVAVCHRQAATGFRADSAGQPARARAGLGARHQPGATGGAAGAGAEAGDTEARCGQGRCGVLRQARVQADPGHVPDVRGEHRRPGDRDRRELLRLLPGRLVRRAVADRAHGCLPHRCRR